MDALLTAIVSALVGGVVATIGAVLNNYLNGRTKVDESLRDKRIEVYQKLWAKTSLLPQWPSSTDVTYGKLASLSKELRDWYFDEGGIYLSAKARAVYGELQETLTSVIREKPAADLISSDAANVNNDYDTVRKKCSALRTELTNDLLSRRRAFLLS